MIEAAASHADLLVAGISLLAAIPSAWVPSLRQLAIRLHLAKAISAVAGGITVVKVEASGVSTPPRHLAGRVEMLELQVAILQRQGQFVEGMLSDTENRVMDQLGSLMLSIDNSAKADNRVQAKAAFPAFEAILLQSFEGGWAASCGGKLIILSMIYVALGVLWHLAGSAWRAHEQDQVARGRAIEEGVSDLRG